MKSSRKYLIEFLKTQTPGDYSILDIGTASSYYKNQDLGFSSKEKAAITKALKKIESSNGSVFCYLSNPFLHVLEAEKNLLKKFQGLVQSEKIVLVGGTAFHSISSLLSARLFEWEVNKHAEAQRILFQTNPKYFHNGASIFANDLSESLMKMGFETAFSPAIHWYLQNENQESALRVAADGRLKLMLLGKKNQSQSFVQLISYSELDNKIDAIIDTDKQEIPDKYSIHEPVALTPGGDTLANLLGNNLQRQVFFVLQKLVHKLAKMLKAEDSEEMIISFTQLCAVKQFEMLKNNLPADERHQHFIWLMNCLTDLELRLR